METQLSRALLVAPLVAVATLAAGALVMILGLSAAIGETWFAVYGVAWTGLVLVVLGIPTAYALTGLLVGIARASGTALLAVSFRRVAVAACTGILGAAYGLLWLADNLAEWWIPLLAWPAGLVGAWTFVRMRAGDARAAS